VPVLAALGLTALSERVTGADRRTWMAWAAGSTVLTALLILLLHESGGLARIGRDGVFHGPASSLVLGLLSILVLCPIVASHLGPRPFQVGACILIAVDLATYGHATIPMVTRATVFSEPAIFSQLRRLDPGTYRIMSLDTSMPPNIDLSFGFDDAAGYDYLTEDKAEFLSGLGSIVVGFDAESADVVKARDRRIDALNVRYLIATDYNHSTANLAAHPDRFREVLAVGHLDVFENLRALPRQWLVPASSVLPTHTLGGALAHLRDPNFDPSRAATVTGGVRTNAGATGGPGRVIQATDGDASVTATVTAPAPSVLVVSQYFYPGWQAQLDGRAVPVLQADGVLQGVAVPPGTHRIALRYSPRTYRVGRDVSLASLAVALGLLAAGVVTARRRDD
jgi:hypothetical protein